MNLLIDNYKTYLAETGSEVAAAILAIGANVPPTNANPLTNALADKGLLDVTAAANYLGYNPSGLRKIVKQKRIQYVQNGGGRSGFAANGLMNLSPPIPTALSPLNVRPRRSEPSRDQLSSRS